MCRYCKGTGTCTDGITPCIDKLDEARDDEAIAKFFGVPVSWQYGRPPILPGDPDFESECQDLMDRVAMHRAAYCASECRRRLREQLERHEPPGGWKIDRAVVMALGNLDDRVWFGQTTEYPRSIPQLVVYLDIVEFLQRNGTKFPLYAQDPGHQATCEEVLARLGITLIEEPAAENMIGPGAFPCSNGYSEEHHFLMHKRWERDLRRWQSLAEGQTLFTIPGSTFNKRTNDLLGRIEDPEISSADELEAENELIAWHKTRKEYGLISLCNSDCGHQDTEDELFNEWATDGTLWYRKEEAVTVNGPGESKSLDQDVVTAGFDKIEM